MDIQSHGESAFVRINTCKFYRKSAYSYTLNIKWDRINFMVCDFCGYHYDFAADNYHKKSSSQQILLAKWILLDENHEQMFESQRWEILMGVKEKLAANIALPKCRRQNIIQLCNSI